MNVQGMAAVAAIFAVATTLGCRRETPQPPPPAPPPQAAPAPAAPPPAATAPAEPGRTVGETIDDITITARVNAELARAGDVSALDVNVTTVNGVVQLSGFVANQQQIERAAQIARGVEGVREVRNNLALKPTT